MTFLCKIYDSAFNTFSGSAWDRWVDLVAIQYHCCIQTSKDNPQSTANNMKHTGLPYFFPLNETIFSKSSVLVQYPRFANFVYMGKSAVMVDAGISVSSVDFGKQYEIVLCKY